MAKAVVFEATYGGSIPSTRTIRPVYWLKDGLLGRP